MIILDLVGGPAIACVVVLSIELGLTKFAAPMVSDLLTTRGLCCSICMPDVHEASHEKLTLNRGVLASHACDHRRIHWLANHSAHGVRIRDPIGLDDNRHLVGQGAGKLPIGRYDVKCPIGL